MRVEEPAGALKRARPESEAVAADRFCAWPDRAAARRSAELHLDKDVARVAVGGAVGEQELLSTGHDEASQRACRPESLELRLVHEVIQAQQAAETGEVVLGVVLAEDVAEDQGKAKLVGDVGHEEHCPVAVTEPVVSMHGGGDAQARWKVPARGRVEPGADVAFVPGCGRGDIAHGRREDAILGGGQELVALRFNLDDVLTCIRGERWTGELGGACGVCRYRIWMWRLLGARRTSRTITPKRLRWNA